MVYYKLSNQCIGIRQLFIFSVLNFCERILKKCLSSRQRVAIIYLVLKNGSLVKRLRHCPFTAVTRVRVPSGSYLNRSGNRFCFFNIIWRVVRVGRRSTPGKCVGAISVSRVRILHSPYRRLKWFKSVLSAIFMFSLKSLIDKGLKQVRRILTSYSLISI